MAKHRWRGLAVGAGVVLALSGCWPVPGANPDRTAHVPGETALTPATVAGLDQLWQTDVGDRPITSVVEYGGGVVGGTSAGLHRVNARTGAPTWSWSLPSEIIDIGFAGAPVVVDGRVLVGHGFGNLGGHWTSTWLDAATGASTAGPNIGPIQTARGTDVASVQSSFGSGTPVLTTYSVHDVAADARRGGGWLTIDGWGRQHITLGAATAYQAGNGPIPPAPGGTWTQGLAVRSFPFGNASTCGPPEAARFACATWTTPVAAAPTAPVLHPRGTTLYVGTSAGTVLALDTATGGLRWTAQVGAPVAHPPALADGVLYVPTDDGDVVAVDAAACNAAGTPSCAPEWSAPVDGTAFAAQPAVAGSGDDAVVVVATTGGTVAALDGRGCGGPTCGAPRWQASVGNTITGAPAIVGGRIHVGTSDGRLVTFGLPPT